MKIDRLLAFTRQPELLREDETQDLEELVKEYPYFTTAQWLLTLKYKNQNSSRFNRQLQKVAVYAPDQQHLSLALHEDLQQLLAQEDDFQQPQMSGAPEPEEKEEAVSAFDNKETPVSDSGTDAGEKPVASGATPASVVSLADILVNEEAATAKPAAEPNGLPTETGSSPEAEETVAEEPETALETDATDSGTKPDPEEEVEDILIKEAEAGNPPQPESEQEISIPAVEMPAAVIRDFETDVAAFLQTTHDRLSWFRFYAGKPLREQPDDVLEELYLEHMSGDLLQAEPATMEELKKDLKALVNHDPAVSSDKEIEAEIRRLAYESISDEELPASETLAGIYESQKDYKKALRIYQKLMLKFPDRMTYFAGLVANTKAKLNN